VATRLYFRSFFFFRSITKLPIILKGILHPDDARLAVKFGAKAVIVSNHGARQLDGVPASIDALPGIPQKKRFKK
jgi:4-hydroxymandelate oxidase